MRSRRLSRGAVRPFFVLFTLTLVWAWAVAAYASPNGSCLTCHNRIAFDPLAFEASVHGERACSDCHRNFAGDPHGQVEVEAPEEEWLQAVIAAESYTNGSGDAWAACGTCHEEVLADMAASSHVLPALERGSDAGAFCRDCHGPPHYIGPAPHAREEHFEFVHETCEPCHADLEIIAEFDLNPDVVFTYEESIHGRAARLGSERSPTCVDCHNAHRVQSGDSPDSPLAEGNRAEVCGACHEGANDTFASVFSHTRITRESRPGDYWATFFFVSLTLIVIFLLMVHMLLDFIAGLRQQFSKR